MIKHTGVFFFFFCLRAFCATHCRCFQTLVCNQFIKKILLYSCDSFLYITEESLKKKSTIQLSVHDCRFPYCTAGNIINPVLFLNTKRSKRSRIFKVLGNSTGYHDFIKWEIVCRENWISHSPSTSSSLLWWWRHGTGVSWTFWEPVSDNSN